MKSISTYFEELAALFLNHSENDCHFSDATVFSARVPRVMHFPCMGIDVDGFVVSGQPGNEKVVMQYNVYIVDHVRDTGSFDQLQQVFGSSYTTVMKILKHMKADNSQPACYFDFSSVEGSRIEFKDAALYGYAVTMTFQLPFDLMACLL